MKKSNYTIAFSCMLVSMLVTMQAKSYFEPEEIETEVEEVKEPSISYEYIEELQANLIEEQSRTRYFYEQVELYRNQIEIYKTASIEAGGYSKILYEQLVQANLVAGLTDVSGQGVVVTMKDSEDANIYNLNENNFIYMTRIFCVL
ncbi:MAG: hypothetical protein R3Y12_00100 [Clostridia bacterium]